MFYLTFLNSGMDCLHSNSASKCVSDKFIVCWLCERIANDKRFVLSARVIDALNNSLKGIHCSCSDCRAWKINFNPLISQTKRGFEDLSKKLIAFMTALTNNRIYSKSVTSRKVTILNRVATSLAGKPLLDHFLSPNVLRSVVCLRTKIKTMEILLLLRRF